MSNSVLIVSSSEKGTSVISSLVQSERIAKLVTATSVAEATGIINSEPIDILIIDTPIKDETGLEFAVKSAKDISKSVIALVNKADAHKVEEKTEKYGVITLEKPIDRPVFIHTVKILTQINARYRQIQKQNEKLQIKLTEVKLFERAKNVLIRCLKMTEEQAHHYIEKTAMDMRLTKREVAVSIINTYTDSY